MHGEIHYIIDLIAYANILKVRSYFPRVFSRVLANTEAEIGNKLVLG